MFLKIMRQYFCNFHIDSTVIGNKTINIYVHIAVQLGKGNIFLVCVLKLFSVDQNAGMTVLLFCRTIWTNFIFMFSEF